MNNEESFNTYEEKEMVNYLDENKNIVGSMERKEAIEKGVLLQAVQLWIINPKTKQVLVQRRSLKKENDAGMIDASSSGHVQEGETPIQAVLRETLEEIGLPREILLEKLQAINQVEMNFAKLGRKGRYITFEYVATLKYPLEFYVKQDEEIDELFFMNYEDLKEKIRNRDKNMRMPYSEDTEILFNTIDQKIYNINS